MAQFGQSFGYLGESGIPGIVGGARRFPLPLPLPLPLPFPPSLPFSLLPGGGGRMAQFGQSFGFLGAWGILGIVGSWRWVPWTFSWSFTALSRHPAGRLRAVVVGSCSFLPGVTPSSSPRRPLPPSPPSPSLPLPSPPFSFLLLPSPWGRRPDGPIWPKFRLSGGIGNSGNRSV